MKVTPRRANAADAARLGEICYRAFKAIAEAHNFPPDFPSPDAAAALLAGYISHERIFSVVGEIDGKIVGSNFLDERNPISGLGPITVDPALQNDGAGRVLMHAVLRRSQERGSAGIRLVQAGYHNRTLALYLKLGFEAREQLACIQGPAVGRAVADHPTAGIGAFLFQIGLRSSIKSVSKPVCSLVSYVHNLDGARMRVR